MKDLDFDELDRAVNTLMGSVSGVSEPAKQDDTKTLTITETIKDDKPPVLPVGEVKVEAVTTSVASTTPAAPAASVMPTPALPKAESAASPAERAPSLATRRSGRFMDVVRPGAAMKPAETHPVSRQGATVAPLAPIEPDTEVTVSKSETPAPTAPSAPAEPVPVADAGAWPDPIDLQEDTADRAPAGEATPLTTPFIADAKVEKRPLGSPAPAAEASSEDENEPALAEPATTDESATDGSAVQPEQASPAVQEAAPAVLPEELQSDLMAIESDQATAPAEPKDEPKEEVPAPVSETLPEAEPETAPASEPVAAAPVAAAPAATIAVAGSIPQQYKEQPSSGDQTTGAIYDTEAYHQPLEHPVKKKASWLWMVWVAILLILGAGGGALAYLFLLQ